MATKRTKPSKLPTRTVFADDLVIEVDGVEYRPHAGESVTFRGGVTVDDYLSAVALQGVTAEAAPEATAGAFVDTLANLASRIVAWDWTDDAGKPCPSPPTVETLRALRFEELGWLLAQSTGASPGAASKNS